MGRHDPRSRWLREGRGEHETRDARDLGAPVPPAAPGEMRAVRMHGYGGPDVLAYEEAPRPTPDAGQVLVRLEAAGVNPLDWKQREGLMRESRPLRFPAIPGGDMAGVVEEVGPGVTAPRRHQAVYGLAHGSYAAYAVADVETLAPAPATLAPLDAAAVPVAAMTAWQALFDVGGLAAGQTVVVQGAAGGVGTFAVQLAKWKGARVVGTASADDVDFVVRDLGADACVDYRAARVDEEVVGAADLVLDLVGGDAQERLWGTLKPGEMLVATPAPPPQDRAAERGVRAAMVRMAPSSALLATLAGLLDEGQWKVVVGAAFPLAEAARAQELSRTGHVRGKIALRVG